MVIWSISTYAFDIWKITRCDVGVVLTKTSLATKEHTDEGAYPEELRESMSVAGRSKFSETTYRSDEH